jgi:hypothetical protein
MAGTSTAVGDLSLIFKYALWQDAQTGDLLSAGLAVTTPTGPDSFAGSQLRRPAQHCLATVDRLYRNFGDFYLHGFTAIDVPTSSSDVTMLYNDGGIGYFLYRTPQPDALVTRVAPTFEVHVNTPLNHRGVLSFTDPAGTPDWVDLTAGVNIEFCHRARLAIGVVSPVTGPSRSTGRRSRAARRL